MALIYNNGRNPALPRYYFPHYGGSDTNVCLAFDEPNWAYFRIDDGSWKKQYGVTGTVKIIDHSAVLMRWAVKRCFLRLETILRTQHLGPDGCIQVFETELAKIIETAKRADRDEFEEAGAVGTATHNWLEDYVKTVIAEDTARGDELLAKMPVDERSANGCVAGLTWIADHNVRFKATERKIVSLEFGYAGTMDGLALTDSCSNPKCCHGVWKDRLSLIDYKTSNHLRIEYLMQVQSYRRAFEEETLQHIDDVWVIRLGKEDAEVDPWHIEREDFEEDWRGFYNALQLVKSVESIQGRIDGVMDGRKAAVAEIEAAAKAEQCKIACPKSIGYKGQRLSKCLPDGTQCAACRAKYEEMHNGKAN